MRKTTGLDGILGNLDKNIAQLLKDGNDAMEEVCAALEGWAKSEHRYTDRTSNNTNSIRGYVQEVGTKLIRGKLTAGMEYSVFLELARDGKWAFLLPVVIRHQKQIIAILEKRMKLGSGSITVTLTKGGDE